MGGRTDHTWIGLVEEEANRAHYVPDSVDTLTVAELKTMMREKTINEPTDPNDPHSEMRSLTNTQKDKLVVKLLKKAGYNGNY